MNNKAYRAIDISKYILCRAEENGDALTNLKLQKLLYYAQAHYLLNNNKQKLFIDDIEMWKCGPVLRDVYHTYKLFGNRAIEEKVTQEDFDRLERDTRQFMDDFLAEFMDLSATSLMNMIHNDSPHIDVYGKVISTHSMYDYYSKLYK